MPNRVLCRKVHNAPEQFVLVILNPSEGLITRMLGPLSEEDARDEFVAMGLGETVRNREIEKARADFLC